MVFYHELSHAIDKRIKGELKQGQDPLQEITAELSAEVLCRLTGRGTPATKNTYQYIEMYAEEAKLTPVNACLQVIGDVEKIVNFLMEFKANVFTENLPRTYPPALSACQTA
jgi:hypothetical protein